MGSASIAERSPDPFEFPAKTWARAKRPWPGIVLRWWLAATIVVVALSLPTLPAKVAGVLVGAVVFVGLPSFAFARLDRRGSQLARVSRSDASGTLGRLPEERWVAMFAPFAWLAVQRARLLTTIGDPKAAALALGEAVRLSGGALDSRLLSLQADALLQADDRRAARQILADLEQRGLLSTRDHLNMALALLEERGSEAQVLSHLEAAGGLDGNARTTMAYAFVLARLHRIDEAVAALDRAEARYAVVDEAASPQMDVLRKRAQKAVRQAKKGTESSGREPARDRGHRRRGRKATPERESTSRDERRAERRRKKERKHKKRAERSAKPPRNRSARAKDAAADKARPTGKSVTEAAVKAGTDAAEAKPANEAAAKSGAKAAVSASHVTTEQPVKEAALGEPAPAPRPPAVVPPQVSTVTTTPSRLIDDDPWADLVAGDDDEIRPA